jgi:hypothetical protein
MTQTINHNRIEDCRKVAIWATSVGLDVRKISDIDRPSSDVVPFLANVWIDGGVVYYNEETHPGDLLHDLGHIAVSPSWLRSYLGSELIWDDCPEVTDLVDALYNSVVDNGMETPGWKAFIQGDEQATIAWSFAAAQAANINDFLPFENGFDEIENHNGKGVYENLKISANSKICCHAGVASLFHGGMLKSKADFPNLCKWVQD